MPFAFRTTNLMVTSLHPILRDAAKRFNVKIGALTDDFCTRVSATFGDAAYTLVSVQTVAATLGDCLESQEPAKLTEYLDTLEDDMQGIWIDLES